MSPIERQALEYLLDGPDVPGPVVNEEILAAHFVFLGLVERGLAAKGMGNDGPIYSITTAGRAALEEPIIH